MNEDSLCQTVNPALAGIESFGGASGQESALTTKGKAGEPEECTTRKPNRNADGGDAMTDPIRAALEKAACAVCLCEGECFETRHGMMHGPCEKLTGEAANAIAAFLRALPGHILLAGAVLAAAKEERE